MRLEYPKGHPLNLLSKLLLNSLYGRFSMNIKNTSAKILNLIRLFKF